MDELLNRAPCGFISFTDDGGISAVNATLLEWLGYTADELIGAKVESILTVANRIFYQTHFFPLLKLHGKADEIFLTLSSKTREEIPAFVNAVRREEGGRFISHCVLMPVHQRRKYEDEILRAKKAAEEALRSNAELMEAKRQLQEHAAKLDQHISHLEQRNRDLTRLNTVLSHDMREPIRKIAVFADMLRQEDKSALSPMGQRAVDRICSSAVRIDQVVKSLRQYLSVDATAEPLANVSLSDVLDKACRRVCDRTACDDVHVQASTLPVVEGYRSQLMLLFENLIDNSIKFRTSHEPVRISVDGEVVQYNRFRTIRGKYRYVDFAKVVYTDNSMGFEQKYAAQVFQILTKLDPETPGLGFGLAVCKRIVDNHNGSVSVESDPASGARFTILLPVKREA